MTGVSLGQVGSTSLGDPRLKEGHPCCYFWLFQVGPGLLPPPVGHSCPDMVACGISHDIQHPPGPGVGGTAPHAQPLTLSQEPGVGAGGIPRHVLRPLGPEQLSITPCLGFQSTF